MHDELHALMDSIPVLKAKSAEIHALPQTNLDEREHGKLRMIEVYAEAVGCKQTDMAKEFVRKAFLCLRQELKLTGIRGEYISQKLCHSPIGNDYVCFCEQAA